MNIEELDYQEKATKAVNHVVHFFNHKFHKIQEILLELVLQPIHHYISFVQWDSQLMTVK